MKLNTRAQTAQSPNNNSPIVLVHELFGSLDNLGVLARDLVTDHDILQVDMRNHGLSGRSDEMTYAAMAQDLLDKLEAHDLQKVTLIGHSMSGKAVMALKALAPEPGLMPQAQASLANSSCKIQTEAAAKQAEAPRANR